MNNFANSVHTNNDKKEEPNSLKKKVPLSFTFLSFYLSS